MSRKQYVHKFVKSGVVKIVKTTSPDYVPPESDGSDIKNPPPPQRHITDDERELAALGIVHLTVPEVDQWVDDNVVSVNDIKEVLKELIKLNCSSNRSALQPESPVERIPGGGRLNITNRKKSED